MNMTRRMLAALVVCSLISLASPAYSQNLIQWDTQIAIPLPDPVNPKPIVLRLQVPDPANAGQVKVEEVSVAVARWPSFVGETQLQASQRKAQAIATAVNAKLPNQASAAPITRRVLQYVPHPVTRRPVPVWVDVPVQWAIQIRGLAEHPTKPKENPVVKVDDGTKQSGGGGAFRRMPGGGGGSPGSMPYSGSMSGKTSSASGLGSHTTPEETIPSVVALGYYTTSDEMGDAIPTTLVAVYPDNGQSDVDVLMALASQLNQAGVAANYNSMTNRLSLTNFLNSSQQTLVWTNTDSSLLVTMEINSIPEPTTAVLLLGTMAGMSVLARGRRRVRREVSR